MTTKALSIILSFILLVFVIDLVRREKLSFKYALGWMMISFLGIFLSLFEEMWFLIAYKLGFEIPSNFIFFTSLVSIAFLSLVLTIFLCEQNTRNDRFAQRLGLLENKIGLLEKKLETKILDKQ